MTIPLSFFFFHFVYLEIVPDSHIPSQCVVEIVLDPHDGLDLITLQ